MKYFFYIFVTILFCLSCQKAIDRTSSTDSRVTIHTYDSLTIENLNILCKVWGFLKYYHPAVVEGKYDWDNELFHITTKILKASNQNKRNDIMYKWIKSLGNIEVNNKITMLDHDSVKLYPDIMWIENSEEFGKVSAELIKIKNAKRESNMFGYIEFTKNNYPTFINEKTYNKTSFPDTGYRLLALFRYWNAIQYYYPYKYLIDEDWNHILPKFIPKFIDANDELEYKLLFLELITKINDSHASILDNTIENFKGKNTAPYQVTFVEDKAVITDIYHPFRNNSKMRIGDIIIAINHMTIDNLIKERQKYTPASNHSVLLRNIAEDLLRTNKDKHLIEFFQNGEYLSDSIPCYNIGNMTIPSRYNKGKPLFQVLNDNIGYLFLGSTQGGKIPEEINTEGLIIDLRCYPSYEKIKGYADFTQLYPKPVPFVIFTVGSTSSPGLFIYFNKTNVGAHNPEYYKGKKIILVNELTQSHAEFMAMKYQAAPNTIILGSTTAGADGEVLRIAIPGGIWTTFSGVGVYYPDGKETQRVGIIPDIEIKPSIKGIKEGRDEILEKAIEIILQDRNQQSPL